MAEMQGCPALKQFVRKGGMSFKKNYTPGVLDGLSCAVKV